MPGYELFDEAEKRQIDEVMETGILTRYGYAERRRGRWKVRELESAIAARTGAKHVLMTADGTAALTTALVALGVGAGDEVVIPTFTFVASFESVLAAGATPILADVDESLSLSPDAAREAITPRTKAILPVHMCGAAAKIDELSNLAKKNGLLLLEDACQAFGGTYRGRALGTIGDAGCYSFDFNKTVTCGEGGAILTNSDETYKRAEMYHDHGHDHEGEDRGLDGHLFTGYNYRISELHAAIGNAQLAKADRFLAIQRENKKTFKDALSGVPGVEFRELPDPEGDSASFLTFFAPTEASARASAKAATASGVEGVFYWYDNNWHYVRNWGHLKNRRFAHALSSDITNALPDYLASDYSASDAVVSRCVSIAMKLGWTKHEAGELAGKTAEALRSAL
ncbi:MAG: DegT/DnrJ/EryC1/StrS family aminotransferase [Synergistaceae bacterium]|jgi:8-amino-3,8-dideoxy-alpha-D-manno-octulosonate transaminase|nr:DegT/DnrJ/EryC1/StrS family aminotransferase [Synergistaceae bacterium]